MTLTPLTFVLCVLAAAAVAFFLGWVAHRRIGEGKVLGAEQLAEKIVREAEREAQNLPRRFRISQILVVTPQWSTPNGIKVGATRPEVVAFYGRPDETLTGQTPEEFRYWYRRRGLVFIFKDRAVVGITVIAAETPEAPKGLSPDDPAVRKPFLPTPGAAPPTGPRY